MRNLLSLKLLAVSFGLFCGLIFLACTAPIRQAGRENVDIDSLSMAWAFAQVDDSVWATIDTTITDTIGVQKTLTPIWDCTNTATLDSAQDAANRHDYHGKRKCQEARIATLKKHDGHAISRSMMQNAVYCGGGATCPICWECSICGHFDLHSYVPLERVEIHCGDRVWRIRQ